MFQCLHSCVALKGEKDWQKYETARRLKKCVERLRAQYREDWKSKEMRIRQRAVALYFIDKVCFLHTNMRALTGYSLSHGRYFEIALVVTCRVLHFPSWL